MIHCFVLWNHAAEWVLQGVTGLVITDRDLMIRVKSREPAILGLGPATRLVLTAIAT